RAGNGRLRRRIGGAKRALHNGAGHVAHVPAGPTNDAGDARLTAAGKGGRGAAIGVDVGQHLGAVIRQLHEACVGLLKEGDVVVRVHHADRVASLTLWVGEIRTGSVTDGAHRGGVTVRVEE